MIYQALSVALLILGFGFVIFIHELGHFLAAKWAGVRVEQFAVGFGHAVLCWRKRLGVRIGTTRPEYERRIREHLKTMEESDHPKLLDVRTEGERLEVAADDLGLGETEYRLNWMPLGGYVKMMGQDDLRPGVRVDHPKSYNNKTIGQRMVIVSAGVIMNVILAAVGFMIVFLMGFKVPPAVVGLVLPGSPAQQAGLEVGDRILTFDGKVQHDFTKVSLNVALAREAVPTPMTVQRVDGRVETIYVSPTELRQVGFLSLGIGKPVELRGADPRFYVIPEDATTRSFPAESLAILPGDVITHIDGEEVNYRTDYWKLDRAIQQSRGEPIELTVRDEDGKGAVRTELLRPRLRAMYRPDPPSFAGMVPRSMVQRVDTRSPAFGKLLPEDVIVAVTSAGDVLRNPTFPQMIEWLNEAGHQNRPVELTVLRDGELIELPPVVPSLRVAPERFGLGIDLDYFDPTPVIAGVRPDSAADAAGLRAGMQITAVNGQPVETWFDIHQILRDAEANRPVELAAHVHRDDRETQPATFALEPSSGEIANMRAIRYSHALMLDELAWVLHDRVEPRKTSNPLVAAWWGVTETRDFILQFYLTLQRMFEGSVSYKNLMGPVGIVQAGTYFAFRGGDWLIWFLAMISANLAVVNFLPIPIVDGGLFTFLILEKIKGRPLSARTQAIAQVIGMAVILSVFILVTYQDILRLIS